MTLEMGLLVWIHPKVDRRKFTSVQSKKYAQEDLAVAHGNGSDKDGYVTRLIGQSLLEYEVCCYMIPCQRQLFFCELSPLMVISYCHLEKFFLF